MFQLQQQLEDAAENVKQPRSRRAVTPEIDKGKQKSLMSTEKNAALLNYHFRHDNYVEVKPPLLVSHLPDAKAVSYLTVGGTDIRTYGTV